MKKDIIPEADGDKAAGGSRGSSQRLPLLVLLLLVATFAYLYFFTGLIRPHGEAPKTPPPQTTQVRKPIPPRPVQGGETSATTAKPREKQPAQATKEKPAPPQAQAKPAAVAAPQPPARSKQTVSPAVKPARQAPVKVAKAEAQPVGKKQAKIPPVPETPVKARQKGTAKPVPTAAAPSPKAPAQAKVASPAPAVKPAAGEGAYTLLVGEFAVDREMKRELATLKKLGIDRLHEKKSVKVEAMHRLFLADFDTHYAADQEMQKLEKATGSAFILEENGRFSVYAGSYLHQNGAAAEMRRLAQKGFKVGIKTAKVTMPVTRVTAGPFASEADAAKEAGRLKKHGIAARVIKAGK